MIPRPNDVFTIQVGVTYFLLPGIYLLKQKWFLIFVPILGALWLMAYDKINEFLKKIKFINSTDIFLISLFIFLQPYNLNTIAAFSNHSVYLPILIFSFLFINNQISKNNINFSSFLNFEALMILCFIIFGVFLRLHHGVFLFSIVVSLFFLKKFKASFFSSLILLLIIFLSFYIQENTAIKYSKSLSNDFIDEMFRSLISGNLIEFHESNKFINPGQGSFWIEKFVRSFEPYSFFLYLAKFLETSIFSLSLRIVFFIFFIFVLVFNYNSIENKEFIIFSGIFIFGSSLFLFLLPMFEQNYLLPTNFLVIIHYYLFFKKIFKSVLYKIIPIIITPLILIIALAYTGVFENKLVESPEYRIWLNEFKEDSKDFNKDISLVYFDTKKPPIPEIYYWYLNTNFCNNDLDPTDCAKIKNINKIKDIYIIKKETDINKRNIFINSLIKKNYNLKKENKNFIILE